MHAQFGTKHGGYIHRGWRVIPEPWFVRGGKVDRKLGWYIWKPNDDPAESNPQQWCNSLAETYIDTDGAARMNRTEATNWLKAKHPCIAEITTTRNLGSHRLITETAISFVAGTPPEQEEAAYEDCRRIFGECEPD